MKPILFNTEMVRAILDGRKTVTRRVVKFRDGKNPNWTGYVKDGLTLYNSNNEPCNMPAPYKDNDILYVRETWCSVYDGEKYFYLADRVTEREQRQLLDYYNVKWHPSIHMPKEAARIFLKVTDVRVERLHTMTLNDFLSEGIVLRPEAYNDPDNAYFQAQKTFMQLWDSTIKKDRLQYYGWNANPYVWVMEFEVIDKAAAFADAGGNDGKAQ